MRSKFHSQHPRCQWWAAMLLVWLLSALLLPNQAVLAQDAPPPGDVPAEQAEQAEAPAEEPPTAPAPVRVSIAEQIHARLTHAALDSAEPSWLEAAGEQFLVVERRPLDVKEKGTVVLVPGYGQHADWQDVVAPLARQLPEHGWRTVVVDLSLPLEPVVVPEAQESVAVPETPGNPADAPDTAPGTAATDPDAAAPNPDAQEPETPGVPEQPPQKVDPVAMFAEQAGSRVQTVLTVMRSKGTPLLVVAAYGDGARYALQTLKENPGSVDALSIVSGHFETETEEDFGQELAALRRPVLEVSAGRDASAVIRSITARKSRALSAAADYEQRHLPEADHRYTGFSDEVAAILRGWLERRFRDSHQAERRFRDSHQAG